MDAFISRKRRKLSSESYTPPEAVDTPSEQAQIEEESTDFKLAMLASIYPEFEQKVLLDILLAHDGSVEKVSSLLRVSDSSTKPAAAIGYQSSLSKFMPSSTTSPAKKMSSITKKGKTLHLYSPEDVAAHTPCSIVHNFLDPDEADALLKELLLEAPTFEKMTFKLFDNVVSSPHTACFYVETLKEEETQKTEYLYNGDRLSDVRQLTSQMRKIRPKVQAAVNTEVTKRILTHQHGQRLPYQSSASWNPNAAFVNCYSGAMESVGYHSDQMTYLGPRAIIGSISLGVAREFRVRRIVPQDIDSSSQSEGRSSRSKEFSEASGQIAIHLPHNSLLVMHAEMQEEWKHSIAPASAIDPHPIAGNKRINITYRDYKPYMHPRFTPTCNCGVPTVLRVVQRKKENWGRYFWMCHAGNVPGKKGCNFFDWAVFDKEGRPIWKNKKQ